MQRKIASHLFIISVEPLRREGMKMDSSSQSVIKLPLLGHLLLNAFATTSNYLTGRSKWCAVTGKTNWYLVRAIWQHCLLHVSLSHWKAEWALHYLTLIKNIEQIRCITALVYQTVTEHSYSMQFHNFLMFLTFGCICWTAAPQELFLVIWMCPTFMGKSIKERVLHKPWSWTFSEVPSSAQHTISN